MKFLSIVGKVLLTATKIITGLGPLIPQVPVGSVGVVVRDLELLASIIMQVESFGQVLNIPGPEKLRAAVPMISQAILQSSILVGKKIADPVLFKQGATKIADGMADVLNSLDAKVESEDRA